MAFQWIYHDSGTAITAEAHRRLHVGSMLNRSGEDFVLDPLQPRKGIKMSSDFGNELKVSQRGAGANMSVDIAAGLAFVASNTLMQGAYTFTNDATYNLTIPTADPTNPRIDRIGILVDDTELGGTTDTVYLAVVPGTPAASPTVPSEPDVFLTLATVTVAAGATSIVTANISDARVYTGMLGGILYGTSSQLPTAPVPGQLFYYTDWQHMAYWNHFDSRWDIFSPFGFTYSYVPALTASTTSPTLGSNSIARGAWRFLNFDTVWWAAYIQFGTSGTAAGSGNYRVSVPFNVGSNGISLHTSVRGIAVDSSDNSRHVIAGRMSEGNSRTETLFVTNENGAGIRVGNSTPMSWSTNDYISLSGIYRF